MYAKSITPTMPTDPVTITAKRGHPIELLVLVSLIMALIGWGSCAVWASWVEETPAEAAQRAETNLDQTIEDLRTGVNPKTDPRANQQPPVAPWPARHGFATALVIFIVALVVGRVYLFMRQLENQRR